MSGCVPYDSRYPGSCQAVGLGRPGHEWYAPPPKVAGSATADSHGYGEVADVEVVEGEEGAAAKACRFSRTLPTMLCRTCKQGEEGIWGR